MAGCQERLLWCSSLFLLFFVFYVNAKAYDPVFKEFPETIFLMHVRNSRHQPICTVFRKAGAGSKLEKIVHKLWKTTDKQLGYTAWEFGAISADKLQAKAIEVPRRLPALRCYLGQTSFFTYTGERTRNGVHDWLKSLFSAFEENSRDVSLESVKEARQKYDIVLVSFPEGPKHMDIEDMVFKLASDFDSCKALAVHYHSKDIKELRKAYNVTVNPAVAVIHTRRAGGTKSKEEIRLFEGNLVYYRVLHVYLTIKQMRLPVINKERFELNLFHEDTEKWKFKPLLICFFHCWDGDVYAHLEAFRLTIQEFMKRKVNMRLALMDIMDDKSMETMTFKYMANGYMSSLPFTVLYSRDDQKQVSKWYVSKERPYPWQLYQALRDKEKEGQGLVELVGLQEIPEPWGSLPPGQVTLTTEGPYGHWCTAQSHNMTDSDPAPRLKLVKKRKLKPKTKKNTKKLHDLFATETVERSLKKLEGIPLITTEKWADVIEKSHAPRHLYYKSGEWAGEITKVALVVFIMADCGSCRGNMETFKEIQKSVSYIDGGAMYFVNCTAEPVLCKNHNIIGFPTITVFRGLGWMGTGPCLSDKSQESFPNFVRMDYHGVIQNRQVMEWFAGVASDAVEDRKLKPLGKIFQERDVRLVGHLMPKHNSYLKNHPKHTPNYFFSYECLRLVCERLFGIVKCFTIFSPKLPVRFFNDEDMDMVVTDVMLERKDGVKTKVMTLGHSLMDTLDEQKDSSLHQFHAPHRYDLNPRLKCEGNPATCTDFIIDFTLDHSRLPVSPITSAMFHIASSLLKDVELPILIALAYRNNITEDAEFMQELTAVAYNLYQEMMVMTLDVDRYTAWAANFVPVQYGRTKMLSEDDPDPYRMYKYPRICIVQKHDHNRAAFYPPINQDKSTNFPLTRDAITEFAQDFLQDPEGSLTQTERF